MNKLKKIPIKKIGGFTIIEMIVVIAVIGVVASIVFVNVVQYLEKGKIAATKGSIAQIVKAMALYKFQCGCLPSNYYSCEEECEVYADGGSDGSNPEDWESIANKLVSGGFIGDSKLLRADAWGNVYFYDKNDYDNGCSPIWSSGGNGINDSGWNMGNYNCPKAFLGDDIGTSLPIN